MTEANISDLIGETLISVDNVDDSEIVFTTVSGDVFKMYWDNSDYGCDVGVYLDDICGALSDLVGSRILMAEVTHAGENPVGVRVPDYQNSFTWTFYKLATNKGSVTIRWYGGSNGYYSETVNFDRVATRALGINP